MPIEVLLVQGVKLEAGERTSVIDETRVATPGDLKVKTAWIIWAIVKTEEAENMITSRRRMAGAEVNMRTVLIGRKMRMASERIPAVKKVQD
jgi:hypothetical protein